MKNTTTPIQPHEGDMPSNQNQNLTDQPKTAPIAGDSIICGLLSDTMSPRLALRLRMLSSGEPINFEGIAPEELNQMSSELEILKRKLSVSLDSVQTGLKNILLEHWRRNFGLTPGCIVESSRGVKFKMRFVASHSWERPNERPWLVASKIKKNGTPSELQQHLFRDWKVV